MEAAARQPLIETIPERCRMCYTCVRECPAKAIRIAGGQAEVVPERCIGCGNCVRVCSQGAKRVRDGTAAVEALLRGPRPVAAIVAPSFPAEFSFTGYRRFVGAVRSLGFLGVHEVAYGADLVARAYRALLDQNPEGRFISTSCPALVRFVEKYHPDLVPHLAPVVSPMVATARVLRARGPADLAVVFLGPCIGKKDEARDPRLHGEVDEVLTFAELRELLRRRGIALPALEPSDFDPPHPGFGVLFPLARGMLQTAGLEEDFVRGDIVTAGGRRNFVEAVKEFDIIAVEARLLEILCCEGCIMGAGMTTRAPLFQRRIRVSQYARRRLALCADPDPPPAGLDLARSFAQDDRRLPFASEEEIRAILRRLGKEKPEDELNCGACGYETCREHAVAIAKGLAENEMCLPYTIEELRRTVAELAESHRELSETQQALMQSERLASMGQLAAGVAHEVNNPLGVVLLYAHMLLERADGAGGMGEDLRTIVEEADRCKKIVSGLLHFARRNKVDLHPEALDEIVDHCVRLTVLPEKIRVRTAHDRPGLEAPLDRDQMTQVLVNLLQNAASAMPGGGTVRVQTGAEDGRAFIRVSDEGVGIPAGHLGRIFEPFFTTKAMGQGTGLGLAVTYGIVKMHHGSIGVTSNADPGAGPTGTAFTVHIPLEPVEETLCQKEETT